MTRVIILEQGEDGRCELCGKIDELRSYGPNGENICFDCGMKDEPTTSRVFAGLILGKNDA